MAKGNIAVNTENIFPIIKQWLYSDKDIFVRELVSNGCDAVSKLKKLVSLGDASHDGDYFVKVTVDKENKQLIFTDNGIGMTAEEIEKYITQVAFSGAEEFLAKYKNEDSNSTIIGHFGLGFYSAFMVSDLVEINSLSYKPGSKAAHWSCDGGVTYDIDEGSKQDIGTEIILHVSEENKEFLEYYKISEILNRYCSFLPVDIFLENAEKKEEKDGEDKKEPAPINDKNPLWLKNPSQCTDEEYKNFYHKVFMDYEDPLFWIHLNVDYPFNLKGILYFPKLKHEASVIEGKIKLYNNQVFVADNIKEVIPEYLMLLKGCIDCPDLPLNVSRSFLQNDGYVRKVSEHITKKVSDKLCGMFNTDRPSLEKYWDDISQFVKYGCIRDEKFYDRMKDIILYKTTDDKYVTLNEYLENAKEKNKNTVYYASNPEVQAQYIAMFKGEGIEVLLLPYALDSHFISFLEYKNNDVKFKRIDSSVEDTIDKSAESDTELIDLFKECIGDKDLKIETASLATSDMPAIINLSEETRRMQEMSAMLGSAMPNMPEDKKLIINTSSDIVKKIKVGGDKELNNLICNYIYDLALLAHKPLSSEQMTAFLKRSNDILMKIGE